MVKALAAPFAGPETFVVESWDVGKITPYARNPRKNTAAIAAVRASLLEFGWQQPIVVDTKGVIIVGHTRYAAALALGWTTAPVRVADGLSKAQAKAYRLMDNRSHEDADWDQALLALELNDLRLDDFDLTLTGFSEQELEGVLGDVADTSPSPTTVGDAQYLVAVECRDEAEQQQCYERFQREGLTCRLIS